MKFIEFNNVTKTYPNGITACADINVSIEKGEFVFVIGLTASGKSTFTKLLYREEKPTSGVVSVGGVNVGKLRNRKVYKFRRKIGIVFQDYKLLPNLTAYENVAFALECIGLKNSEIRPKVLKALEIVGLKDKVRSFPRELSGGEQQRVCIARAIVNEQSYIENILRLNKGRRVNAYVSFPDSSEWKDKVFSGLVEQAGKDHLILKDVTNGNWYLIRLLYLNYVEFMEPINYLNMYSDKSY